MKHILRKQIEDILQSHQGSDWKVEQILFVIQQQKNEMQFLIVNKLCKTCGGVFFPSHASQKHCPQHQCYTDPKKKAEYMAKYYKEKLKVKRKNV